MQLFALIQTYGLVVMGMAVIFAAFLVNRFAAHRRHRIRYAVILYVLALVATGAATLLGHASSATMQAWAKHAQVVADLCSAFTVVNVVVLIVFDVLLRAVGFAPGALTNDVIVGVAYILAAIGVLQATGISPSSVVTTSAVVSGILALSMQTTLGNIVGGVALQLDGSIHVGDWVQLTDGTQGKVVAIRWRHTLLETRNWDTTIVPNANLLAQNIIVLGKRTGQPLQHRMWVYFNVDFRYAPSRVIDVVREAMWAAPIEGVATEPKPSVICYDFAKDTTIGSSAYYAVRYWLTDLPNDDPTSSRVRTRIYTALRRANIPLARPAQTLFVNQQEDDAKHEARRAQERLHAIECVDLFHSLTPEEREFISGHLKLAPFTAGETCTKQGAVAHWLYVLVAGKAEIRRHTEDGKLVKVLATLEGPTFFGEMGLMTGEPRTADVVAVTDVECYRLDKPGLSRILEERPEVAALFSKTLAKRRVELLTAAEGLDAEAQRARMVTEEAHILDKIQDFFGLAKTSTR